jgi:hypothetical protein
MAIASTLFSLQLPFDIYILCFNVIRVSSIYSYYMFLKECGPVVLLIVHQIKSISVQTQLNSIYYIELYVSTYLRSSSD